MRLLTGLLVSIPLLTAPATLWSGEAKRVPDPRWGAFFSEKNQRVATEPTGWPWQAIGRVNIADSVTRRHCTGTLVGPRLVLTAAHCLFDTRLRRWVNPERVHFVAGQARDTFQGHAEGEALILPPEADRQQTTEGSRTLRRATVPHDWALIRLKTELPIRPVPVAAVSGDALARAVAEGRAAKAGYSADRKYLLSVQRGCAVTIPAATPRLLVHHCDSLPGDSGSPIMLLEGDGAVLIGLSSGAAHVRGSDGAFMPREGLGPAASAFANAVAEAVSQ